MRTTALFPSAKVFAIALASGMVALLGALASCSGGSSTAAPSDGGPTGEASGDTGTTGDGQGVPPPLDCQSTLALDPGFGTNGIAATPPGFAAASLAAEPLLLAPLPDAGVILMAGKAIVKLRGDGSVDETFQPDQVFFDPDVDRRPAALAVGPSGAVAVAWSVQRNSGPPGSFTVGRLTPAGALDPSFGQNGASPVPPFVGDAGSLQVQSARLVFGPDGSLHVLEAVQQGGAAAVMFLSKFDASGHLVATYATRAASRFRWRRRSASRRAATGTRSSASASPGKASSCLSTRAGAPIRRSATMVALPPTS
jgi:hypothetical protein